MLSFFLSVWKKTEQVLFEGGIQVGQAENGGVRAQKGGVAGRKDRQHRSKSRRPCVVSSCLQSFPASGSFPVSQFFASGGQSTRGFHTQLDEGLKVYAYNSCLG